MRVTREEQIRRMKAQTFGVEIECNHISRQHAAETVRDFLGRGGRCGISRDGTDYIVTGADGRTWTFHRDSSILGPEEEKCEVITPVLRYEDMEMLQEMTRQLRHAGAKSAPSRGCGVHIHIGVQCAAGDHDARSLRNLVNMMAAHEEQIGRAIHLDTKRKEKYCQAVHPDFLERLNREKPKSMEGLARVWYEEHETTYNRDMHYNGSRYHMLNLHSVFTRGTIEFRMFQFEEMGEDRRGGLHAGRLKAYIQLCLAMSERAKEVQYASWHPQQRENEKYALRCWMLQLGFIGDEFRTARRILTREMQGNAAWR